MHDRSSSESRPTAGFRTATLGSPTGLATALDQVVPSPAAPQVLQVLQWSVQRRLSSDSDCEAMLRSTTRVSVGAVAETTDTMSTAGSADATTTGWCMSG